MKDLPSRGVDYPSGAVLRIRPLTVGDVKYLCTINSNNATSILNEVITDCVKLEGMKHSDLLYTDRKFLLLWIRANTFVSTSGYEVALSCPFCDSPIEKKLSLNQLKIRYAEESNETSVSVELDGKLVNIQSRIPNIYVDLPNTDDEEIRQMLIYTNLRDYIPADVNVEWYVNNLDAMTYATILGIAQAREYGILDTMEFECDSCGRTITARIQLDDKYLFRVNNLYEIIKKELQLCRYTGYQVRDDESYTYVEVLYDVMNEMLEKEKEESKEGNSTLGMNLNRLNAKNLRNFR